MAEQRKESMMRKYIQTWKKNAGQKAELRESENAQKVGNQLYYFQNVVTFTNSLYGVAFKLNLLNFEFFLTTAFKYFQYLPLQCHRQILLRCFFTSWKQKATEHAQRMTSMVRRADEARQRILVKRSLSRWQRQYAVELKTRY